MVLEGDKEFAWKIRWKVYFNSVFVFFSVHVLDKSVLKSAQILEVGSFSE